MGGRLVGIDQQVNHIEPGPGLDTYLGDVRDLSAQVLRGGAPTVTLSVHSAIKKQCGVELSDTSLARVIEGMGTILRKAALESKDGRLAEALAAAAASAGEMKFDYDGYFGSVSPIDPVSVAAKDVA